MIELLVLLLFHGGIIAAASVIVLYLTGGYKYLVVILCLPVILAIPWSILGASSWPEVIEIAIGPIFLAPLVTWLCFKKYWRANRTSVRGI